MKGKLSLVLAGRRVGFAKLVEMEGAGLGLELEIGDKIDKVADREIYSKLKMRS